MSVSAPSLHLYLIPSLVSVEITVLCMLPCCCIDILNIYSIIDSTCCVPYLGLGGQQKVLLTIRKVAKNKKKC